MLLYLITSAIFLRYTSEVSFMMKLSSLMGVAKSKRAYPCSRLLKVVKVTMAFLLWAPSIDEYYFSN